MYAIISGISSGFHWQKLFLSSLLQHFLHTPGVMKPTYMGVIESSNPLTICPADSPAAPRIATLTISGDMLPDARYSSVHKHAWNLHLPKYPTVYVLGGTHIQYPGRAAESIDMRGRGTNAVGDFFSATLLSTA